MREISEQFIAALAANASALNNAFITPSFRSTVTPGKFPRRAALLSCFVLVMILSIWGSVLEAASQII